MIRSVRSVRGVDMDLKDRTIGIRQIVVLTVSGVMLAFAGCHSKAQFRPAYLSETSRLVGGGLKIQWRAPEPGTVYLVEKRTGKLVQTLTLEAGESYDFKVESIVDAEELGDMLGVNMAKAQFLLYFKPAGKESGTSQP